MNKEIVVTRDDFKAFAKYALTRLSFAPYNTSRSHGPHAAKKYSTAVIILSFLLIVVLAVLIRIFMPENPSLPNFHWPTALITSAFFVFIAIVFLVSYARLQDKCYPIKDGLVLGPRSIELTALGVKDSSQYGATSYGWDMVEEVVSHEGNVYIMLDNMHGQIIPSSAFSSDGERESYVTFTKNLHASFSK